MVTPTLRFLGLAPVIAFFAVTSAWAQQTPKMNAALTSDVRDVEVQKQLIALGVLDATAGRASTSELAEAVAWFRKAYKSDREMAGLSDDERDKLKQAKAKFDAVTGLKEVLYRDQKTSTDLKLLVPAKIVPETAAHHWTNDEKVAVYEYRDGRVSVGPVVHLLSEFTPIALFRRSIMKEALRYKTLHLTSDEFAAVGEGGSPQGEDGGYISANMVLTTKDKLTGVLLRYPKLPPKDSTLPPSLVPFELPDFLEPIVANDPQRNAETPEAKIRGWQLLMQSVANFVLGEFPRMNGWKGVSTQPCPLPDAKSEQDKGVRVVFGTDRKAKDGTAKLVGPVADPDSLFANEQGNALHLGCAYVVPPAADAKGERVLGDSKITEFRLLHTTDKGDIGEQLYMTDELAESQRPSRRALGKPVRQRTFTPSGRRSSEQDPSSALVFIHGYNVTFKDALFTIAQLKADTKYPGRVYLYSWPSAAGFFSYIADMDNAEQAEPFLQSFMRLLMRYADIDSIDIIVHSMGSQPTLRALSALRSVFETERQGESRQQNIRIGQIMFAAPDVAMPVFDQKIRRIAPYADRVTVYASMTDAALLLSNLARGAGRMGELTDDKQPLLIEASNVHVIDATGSASWWRVDRMLKGYGHDYFRQSKGVLKDIDRILRSVGQADALTPKQRSPEDFEEERFKQNDKWSFWRLKESEKQIGK